jgi:outer membrane receptor protein involved in Fe transport
MLCTLLMGAAFAQEPPRQRYVIAKQPLAGALLEFARQSRIQIFSPETAESVLLAAPLEGTYSPEEALNRLLTGTGYTFVRNGDTFSIVRKREARTTSTETAARITQMSATTQLAAAPMQSYSAPVESAGTEPVVNYLDEVVVTAQRRTQKLLDVPLAVTAFTGERIEQTGANELADFLQEAPGVTVVDAGDGNQSIAIRGIGSVNGDATVGYYLDELPFGLVNLADLPNVRAFDLERVEALRGPQGTLYGAGSMGGTIRILTRNADLNDFEVRTNVVGSTTADGGDNYQLHGAVNVPLVEGKLAFRGVASYEDWGGWVDSPRQKDINDRNMQSYRGKLRFAPTDALDITLSGWFSRQEIGQSSNSLRNRKTTSTNDPRIEVEYDLFSAVIDYQAPGVDILSATSYIDYHQNFFANLGLPAPVAFNSPADNFTQEVRLASRGDGAMRWTVGGIYQDLSTDAFIGLPAGFPFFGPSLTAQTSKSWAVFGEGTYAFLDGMLEATAGLRYFEDERETVETLGTTVTGRTIANFDSVSPRFNLAFKPAPGWLWYANVAKGFRSGQTQLATPRLFDPDLPLGIDAETLWSYEVGVKASLAGGRLVAEAAVYRNEWQDLQTPVSVSVSPPFVGILNVGSASSQGLDLSLDFQPLSGLNLRLNGNYNDATYDEDVADLTGIVIRKGQRISGVPKYTLNGSVSYGRALSSDGLLAGLRGFTYLGVQYNSPRDSVGANAIGRGEDVTLVNGRIGVEKDAWGLFLFVDNITDSNQAMTGQLPAATRPRPRTVGLNLRTHF